MQKRRKLEQQLLIATCAGAVLISTGCQSSLPKWNLFGSRNTPSAEALAGQGPTMTYPAPPGETATPNAIASVAGGTAEQSPQTQLASSAAPGAPITGFDAPESKAAQASATVNPAAAQANGFQLASGKVSRTGSAEQSAAAPNRNRSTGNSAVPSIPAGYQFGGRNAAPTAAAKPGGRYQIPSAYPAPGAADSAVAADSKQPSSYALPASVAAMAPTSSTPAKPSGQAPGMTLPGSAPTTEGAAPATASLSDSGDSKSTQSAAGAMTAAKAGKGKTATAALSLPSRQPSSTPAKTASTGKSSASFSTASAALAPRSDVTPSSDSKTQSGYAPGSTAGGGAYPTTSGYPSTGTEGSFYR